MVCFVGGGDESVNSEVGLSWGVWISMDLGHRWGGVEMER